MCPLFKFTGVHFSTFPNMEVANMEVANIMKTVS